MSQDKLKIKSNLILPYYKKQSCLILLVNSFHFNLTEVLFLKQIFIKFWASQKHKAKISLSSSHLFIFRIPFNFKYLIFELICNDE